VDGVDAKPAQAPLARLPQVLRPAVLRPLAAVARPHQSALRRDDEVVRIRMERLGDQLLADVRAVRVGGVYVFAAELHGAAQHGARIVDVGGRAGDPGPGQAHRAEAEAVDLELPGDRERSGRGGGGHGGGPPVRGSAGSAPGHTRAPARGGPPTPWALY